jgi:hypothetical protein
MRKLAFTIILVFLHINSNGQSISPSIKNLFNNLDSTLYMERVLTEIQDDILSKDYYELLNKPEKNIVEIDIIEAIKKRYNSTIEDIKKSKILYVLNIDIDTSKISTNNYLIIDPNYFKFNLFCFEKKKYPSKYILFYDGKLDSYSTFPTYSRKYLKHNQEAYKEVLRKKPEYLLFCWSLPNSVVYVLNDKIFVYRVIQRKVYELDVYVKLFKHTIRKGY